MPYDVPDRGGILDTCLGAEAPSGIAGLPGSVVHLALDLPSHDREARRPQTGPVCFAHATAARLAIACYDAAGVDGGLFSDIVSTIATRFDRNGAFVEDVLAYFKAAMSYAWTEYRGADAERAEKARAAVLAGRHVIVTFQVSDDEMKAFQEWGRTPSARGSLKVFDPATHFGKNTSGPQRAHAMVIEGTRDTIAADDTFVIRNTWGNWGFVPGGQPGGRSGSFLVKASALLPRMRFFDLWSTPVSEVEERNGCRLAYGNIPMSLRPAVVAAAVQAEGTSWSSGEKSKAAVGALWPSRLFEGWECVAACSASLLSFDVKTPGQQECCIVTVLDSGNQYLFYRPSSAPVVPDFARLCRSALSKFDARSGSGSTCASSVRKALQQVGGLSWNVVTIRRLDGSSQWSRYWTCAPSTVWHAELVGTGSERDDTQVVFLGSRRGATAGRPIIVCVVA
uniref:Peptidase C1A papain C-terminal domain-containing protein n=1 Tax=Neobodo designis TaxID=312471 RepID=A0A7S1MKS9_NEODS